jgi:hypothetical protein
MVDGRRWLAKSVVPRVALAAETVRTIRARARLAGFQQRHRVVRRFPAPRVEPERPRVVAVVTHVADPSRSQATTVERLERTLEGLLESLGHTRLELVLSTLPDRHVAAELPEHLRSRLTVREQEVADPMFLGFEAQGEFERRAGEADWFLYLEDDLVLGDALLLEKLAYFNEGAPAEALLLPHRYELWQGRKTYIDLVSRSSLEWTWNRLTELEVGGWRFAEFENPHSGCYCLSQAQLRRWLETGRRWYGLTSYSGPRESAATGCLAEAFRLYKPHSANMGYLEIRHLGSKYSELYAGLHGGVRD